MVRLEKNKTAVKFINGRFFLHHDSDRIRTCDRLIKSQLLCQLSYGAKKAKEIIASFRKKNKPNSLIAAMPLPLLISD